MLTLAWSVSCLLPPSSRCFFSEQIIHNLLYFANSVCIRIILILNLRVTSENKMAVDDGVSLYKYTPSFITAVVVAALYSVAFVITFFQWIRYRATVWVVMVVPAGSKHNSSTVPPTPG